MNTTEEWRPVPSNPEILASSLGRIKFPHRFAQMPHGGIREYKTKPIAGVITKSNKKALHEYRGVWHRFYGNLKIHQLICETFHGPKPFPEAVVIHKDEDGLNNEEGNLKWGTQKENLNMPKIKQYHSEVCRAKMERRL